MSALDDLIKAVEAGTFLMDIFPDGRTERIAYEAFSGSLDAAMRLHEALLPGWHYRITRGKHTPEAIVQRDLLAGEHASAETDTPARAWLLAILRALQAQSTPLDEPGPVDPRRRG